MTQMCTAKFYVSCSSLFPPPTGSDRVGYVSHYSSSLPAAFSSSFGGRSVNQFCTNRKREQIKSVRSALIVRQKAPLVGPIEVIKEFADAPQPSDFLHKPVATVVDTTETTKTGKAKEEVVNRTAEKAVKARPKKAAVKSLQATMLEDVIPNLMNSVEEDESDLHITYVAFEDNQLKTSFSRGGVPYCFWAFFPDGTIEGYRGSSLAAHGFPPSTIEPFIADEKKITSDIIVYWIRKRLGCIEDLAN